MNLHNKPLILSALAVAALALLAMLAYNLVHTGGLLASYVDPAWIGYVAAFGIELAVVGLSITIGTRRWHELDTRFLYAVLIAVVVVSFLANVSEGHAERYQSPVTWGSIMAIDWLQGIIGLAATGLISLITMAMAEICGQYLVQIALVQQDGGLAGAELPQTATDRAAVLMSLLPNATDAQIVDLAGCSLSTVRRARKGMGLGLIVDVIE